MNIVGVSGKPFWDLSGFVSEDYLRYVHKEIRNDMIEGEYTYTGGFHGSTSRNIPGIDPDNHDYGNLIVKMSSEQLAEYVAIGGAEYADYTAEELLSIVPNERQKRYLKLEMGAYFPWQMYKQVYPSPEFTGLDGIMKRFPMLGRLIDALKFAEIHKVDILGVDPYHKLTLHRDWPELPKRIPEFIHITPHREKKLFLYDKRSKQKVYLPPVCYFNNYDFHGADPLPYFTYSIRVEGVFGGNIRSHINK